MQAATAHQSGVESESDIIKRHEDLIWYMALPFVSRGIRLDDLMQEGRIALLGAARTWEAHFGAQLWTYAYKFVRGALRRYAKIERKEPSRDLRLVEDLVGEDDEDIINTSFDRLRFQSAEPLPADALETAELVALAAREFYFLCETERRVLHLRFGDELDIRSIAEMLNTSKSDVDRICHGAIAKLRERVEARL